MALPRSVGKSKWFNSARKHYWNVVRPLLRFRTRVRRRIDGAWKVLAGAIYLRGGIGRGQADEKESEKVVTKVSASALLDLMDSMSDKSFEQRAPYMYAAIIKRFLGERWLEKHVMAAMRNPSAPAGYVGYVVNSGLITEDSRLRVHNLAEMLLNLQGIPGFHDRIEQFKDFSREQVESAYAELEAARVLLWHDLAFRFVEKVHNPKLGEDYDFEAINDGGHIIAIDAKCKFDSTGVSAQSLGGSLHEARWKLPENKPSSIIVKVPHHWFNDEATIPPEYLQVTLDFLKDTGRVASVIYYTPFPVLTDTELGTNHRWREIENKDSRFREIVTKLLTPNEGVSWIVLDRLIKGRPR